MKPQVLTSYQIEWMPLSNSEASRFTPQLEAGLEWLLDVLDETEGTRKLSRTKFDQADDERLRRAS